MNVIVSRWKVDITKDNGDVSNHLEKDMIVSHWRSCVVAAMVVFLSLLFVACADGGGGGGNASADSDVNGEGELDGDGEYDPDEEMDSDMEPEPEIDEAPDLVDEEEIDTEPDEVDEEEIEPEPEDMDEEEIDTEPEIDADMEDADIEEEEEVQFNPVALSFNAPELVEVRGASILPISITVENLHTELALDITAAKLLLHAGDACLSSNSTDNFGPDYARVVACGDGGQFGEHFRCETGIGSRETVSINPLDSAVIELLLVAGSSCDLFIELECTTGGFTLGAGVVWEYADQSASGSAVMDPADQVEETELDLTLVRRLEWDMDVIDKARIEGFYVLAPEQYEFPFAGGVGDAILIVMDRENSISQVGNTIVLTTEDSESAETVVFSVGDYYETHGMTDTACEIQAETIILSSEYHGEQAQVAAAEGAHLILLPPELNSDPRRFDPPIVGRVLDGENGSGPRAVVGPADHRGGRPWEFWIYSPDSNGAGDGSVIDTLRFTDVNGYNLQFSLPVLPPVRLRGARSHPAVERPAQVIAGPVRASLADPEAPDDLIVVGMHNYFWPFDEHGYAIWRIYAAKGEGGWSTSAQGMHLAHPDSLTNEPVAARLADVDGDDYNDLIMAVNFEYPEEGMRSLTGSQLVLFRNLQNGGFGEGEPLADFDLDSSGGLLADLAVGDFNGDGFPDIAAKAKGKLEVHLYFNDQSGGFVRQTAAVGDASPSNSPGVVLAGNFDSGAGLDLAIGGYADITIFSNDGAGAFSQLHHCDMASFDQSFWDFGHFITGMATGKFNAPGESITDDIAFWTTADSAYPLNLERLYVMSTADGSPGCPAEMITELYSYDYASVSGNVFFPSGNGIAADLDDDEISDIVLIDEGRISDDFPEYSHGAMIVGITADGHRKHWAATIGDDMYGMGLAFASPFPPESRRGAGDYMLAAVGMAADPSDHSKPGSMLSIMPYTVNGEGLAQFVSPWTKIARSQQARALDFDRDGDCDVLALDEGHMLDESDGGGDPTITTDYQANVNFLALELNETADGILSFTHQEGVSDGRRCAVGNPDDLAIGDVASEDGIEAYWVGNSPNGDDRGVFGLGALGDPDSAWGDGKLHSGDTNDCFTEGESSPYGEDRIHQIAADETRGRDGDRSVTFKMIEALDIDRSGNKDIVVFKNDPLVGYYAPGGRPMDLMLSEEVVNMRASGQNLALTDTSYSLGAADFNDDGDQDLLCLSPQYPMSIFRGASAGPEFFIWGEEHYDAGGSEDPIEYPRGFAIGDFDEDSYPDIATSWPGILFGDADYNAWEGRVLSAIPSNFNPSQETGGSCPEINSPNIAAGDINGDGHLDLAIYKAHWSHVYILVGDGKGNFATTPPLLAATAFSDHSFASLLLADFDNDAHLDLMVLTSEKVYDSPMSMAPLIDDVAVVFQNMLSGTGSGPMGAESCPGGPEIAE